MPRRQKQVELCEFEASLIVEQVSGQSGLHRETLSLKTNKTNNDNNKTDSGSEAEQRGGALFAISCFSPFLRFVFTVSLKGLKILFSVYEDFACMYVLHCVCVRCLWKSEEGARSPALEF